MQERQSNRQKLLDDLSQVVFLRGLDPSVLRELVRQAVWREYAARGVIFLEGEPVAALYHLHSGWLKVIKSSPEGREQILRFLGPGETFNELGVFANLANPATAVALEPAGVWLVPRDAVRALLLSHPDMALHVIENIAGRVIDLVALVSDLSLRTVEARLARLLLSEAVDQAMPRPRWATQSELAARLGTVPDVLSRVLRSLSDAGVIAVERAEIRLLDRPALERLAQLDT